MQNEFATLACCWEAIYKRTACDIQHELNAMWAVGNWKSFLQKGSPKVRLQSLVMSIIVELLWWWAKEATFHFFCQQGNVKSLVITLECSQHGLKVFMSLS